MMEGKGDCDKNGEKIDELTIQTLAWAQTQALERVKLHNPAIVSESVSVAPPWKIKLAPTISSKGVK